MAQNFFKNYGLFLSWLIAMTAVIATLFFSEVLHWKVCNLCWYQRIAIYPLVILLGIAAFRDDKNIIPYVKTFCMIGLLLAIYQYAEQMIPGFAPLALCTQGISCAETPIKLLGFITVPLLSAIACALMYAILSMC
ncbi:MAG: disulfide bond formation protein B [Coxiellaceae bacterium]|nr:disulfide bond formation protein B [Coxiellaceae bacterium]